MRCDACDARWAQLIAEGWLLHATFVTNWTYEFARTEVPISFGKNERDSPTSI